MRRESAPDAYRSGGGGSWVGAVGGTRCRPTREIRTSGIGRTSKHDSRGGSPNYR